MLGAAVPWEMGQWFASSRGGLRGFSPTRSNGLGGPKCSRWLNLPPSRQWCRGGGESHREQPSKIAGVNHAPPVPVPHHRLQREMSPGSSDSGLGWGVDGGIGLVPTAPIPGWNLLLSDPKCCWGWFHTPVLSSGAGQAAARLCWLMLAAGLVRIIRPNPIFGWRSPGSGRGRGESHSSPLQLPGEGAGLCTLPNTPPPLAQSHQDDTRLWGTRRGLMLTPAGKSRGQIQTRACRGAVMHGPRGTPGHPPHGCTGPLAPRARLEAPTKGPVCGTRAALCCQHGVIRGMAGKGLILPQPWHPPSPRVGGQGSPAWPHWPAAGGGCQGPCGCSGSGVAGLYCDIGRRCCGGSRRGVSPRKATVPPRGIGGCHVCPPSAHLWGCRRAGRRGTAGTGQQGPTAGTRPWG